MLYKKLFKFIFDVFVSKTPENWGALRRLVVKKYILYCGGGVSIGRKCKVHRNTRIGDYSGIGYGCEIPNGVTIGKHVMMGPNVLMYTQNHCTEKVDIPMRMQGMRKMQPILIEDDVWIGARVCILPGITIGHGSVIGACAVVSKDVPPYSVVVGNPGRIVKSRLTQQKTILEYKDEKLEN